MDDNKVSHESICLKLTIENSFGSPIALMSNAYIPDCFIRITHSTIYFPFQLGSGMAIQDFTDKIVMSNFFHDVHFSLITVYSMAKSIHYASIMLDASRHLLCLKLCQHNRLVPNQL